jgi:hypothetical protein
MSSVKIAPCTQTVLEALCAVLLGAGAAAVNVLCPATPSQSHDCLTVMGRQQGQQPLPSFALVHGHRHSAPNYLHTRYDGGNYFTPKRRKSRQS